MQINMTKQLFSARPYCCRGLAAVLSLLLAASALLSPLSAGLSFAAPAIEASVQAYNNNYRLGPGDVISVRVYQQDEFKQDEILVRPDGLASFLGIGDLEVGGHTVSEVNKMVEQRISDLIVDPIVTISVTRPRPATVYLAGAVMRPGAYQVSISPQQMAMNMTPGAQLQQRTDMRLSNVLINGGGLAMNADLRQVQVRRGDGTSETVNLWDMIRTGETRGDLWLQSGDSIYVPELPQMAMNDEDFNLLLRSSIGPTGFPVRVIGWVRTPGVVDLIGNSPYLNSAISKAGGYMDNANKKMVAIRRFTSASDFTTLYVDPNKADLMLRPNDVVYISEQKIQTAGRFMEAATKILSPFQTAAQVGFSAALLRNVR